MSFITVVKKTVWTNFGGTMTMEASASSHHREKENYLIYAD